jgi:hypothetical protein
MHLIPIGGLCNRLRTIFSHLEWCRTTGNGEILNVYWYIDPACFILFSSLFQLEGLKEVGLVIHEPGLPQRPPAMPNTIIRTCSVHRDVPLAAWGALAVRLLQPVSVIQGRIDAILTNIQGDFTALHIRRTDHNSNYDQDAVFVEYAGLEGPVYAATDNPRSMVTLKKALGSRLHYNGRFAQSGIRLTEVADAVVDLWVCATATRFRGTYYSSFSDWIEMMRSLRGATPGDLTKIT